MCKILRIKWEFSVRFYMFGGCYVVHIWAKKHLIVWIASGTTRTERCKDRHLFWFIQIFVHKSAYIPSIFLFSCQFGCSNTIYTWFFRILCQHGLYHIGSRWYLYPSIGIMSSFLCSYWGCMWCQCISDSQSKLARGGLCGYGYCWCNPVQERSWNCRYD